MTKELQKIIHPTSRFCLKRCENFDFHSLDKILNEVCLFIEQDYNLHLSHYRASLFFSPNKWQSTKQCFAGFEVVGLADRIEKDLKDLKFIENGPEFVLVDIDSASWLRSYSFGEFYYKDSSIEFSKKVFNFLDNLHNREYSEDLSARLLVDFKSREAQVLPEVFIELFEESIIDIDTRAK